MIEKLSMKITFVCVLITMETRRKSTKNYPLICPLLIMELFKFYERGLLHESQLIRT